MPFHFLMLLRCEKFALSIFLRFAKLFKAAVLSLIVEVLVSLFQKRIRRKGFPFEGVRGRSPQTGGEAAGRMGI